MSVIIEKNFCNGLADALDDIKKTGFWPTTFILPAGHRKHVHWHSYEVNIYVMEGNSSFYDEKSGQTHLVTVGDKITVPAKTLHAEGAVDGRLVYLIALPDAQTSEDFLKPMPPDELK
jgi:quercetin dioxygenase-like cupin family protein